MAIYIITFLIATIMFKLGDYSKRNHRVYLDLIAVLILCLVAGLRDKSIGTDTAVYIRPLIDYAISSDNFRQFLLSGWMIGGIAHKAANTFEIGYTSFIYLVSRCSKSVVLIQTALELLAVLPVYKALRLKGGVPVWFGMLVYMLLFFIPSLNLSRQSIAMAFVLLAITYWMKTRKPAARLSLLIGMLFHYSAFIGLLILFVYEFIGHQKDRIDQFQAKFRFRNMLIALAAGILLILMVNPVIRLLNAVGLSRYANYINGEIHFLPNQIIRNLPSLILLLLSFKRFKGVKTEWAFYTVMIVYVMLIGQFNSISPQSGRIGYYFQYFSIYSSPLACISNKYRKTMTLVMIAYLVFYWWYSFALMGACEAVPYRMIP